MPFDKQHTASTHIHAPNSHIINKTPIQHSTHASNEARRPDNTHQLHTNNTKFVDTNKSHRPRQETALIDIDVLELMSQVLRDGCVVGIGFLEDPLARFIDDLSKVPVPLGTCLTREHYGLEVWVCWHIHLHVC